MVSVRNRMGMAGHHDRNGPLLYTSDQPAFSGDPARTACLRELGQQL
jgi:hypothetical protein